MDDPNQLIDETTVNVANQIRLLRNRRNLTQRELAEASGLSRNTLSLLERGQTSPTISTLKRLAIALNVDINAFFNTSDEESIVFSKSGQRKNLQLSQVLMADLGVGLLDQLVTPLILKLNPGARSGTALAHDGQDFVYCVKGEVLYTVNGRAFILEAGDSLLFDAHLPHRFQNPTGAESEVLVVLSTPHDGDQYISGHFHEDNEPSE